MDVSLKLLIIAILPQVYFLFEINTANLKKVIALLTWLKLSQVCSLFDTLWKQFLFRFKRRMWTSKVNVERERRLKRQKRTSKTTLSQVCTFFDAVPMNFNFDCVSNMNVGLANAFVALTFPSSRQRRRVSVVWKKYFV